MTNVLDLGWLPLSEDTLSRADLYANILLEWNQKIRLTGYSTIDEIRSHLILESFLAFSVIKNRTTSTIIDFGSGNGTPGLLFSLTDSSIPVILLERIEKKRVFLEYAAMRLGLKNILIMPSLTLHVPSPLIVMKAITLSDLFNDPGINKNATPPWTIFKLGFDSHPSCIPVSTYVINGGVRAWKIEGSVTLSESAHQG